MKEARVADIMIPIEEYETLDAEDCLCHALACLKRNYEKSKSSGQGGFHKTVFVNDGSKKLVGRLSMYDLIRGLVPEASREGVDREPREKYVYTVRSWEIEERAAELAEKLGWLSSTFSSLVKQQAHKKIREIMSPIRLILKEEDTINRAVYLMFRENERQPLVAREGKVVGVLNLMQVFTELLEIAGPECGVDWQC